MTHDELEVIKKAAEILDDNGREILAESLWYVHGTESEINDKAEHYKER